MRRLNWLFILMIIISCTEKKEEKKKIVLVEDKSAIESSMLKQGLVDVQKLDLNIKVDLKYSSKDNFFGQDVYGNLQNAYLQPIVAKALAKANASLNNLNKNYQLIIYDATRPLHIQKILWEKLDTIPPKRRKDFVADPAETSIHNYGCAVDLSIFDKKVNSVLDMGTKYDYFGYLAYPRLENQMLVKGLLNPNQIKNRQLLRNVMMSNGFEPITSEWWHFNFYPRKVARAKFKVVE